jgi:hypothetical protein
MDPRQAADGVYNSALHFPAHELAVFLQPAEAVDIDSIPEVAVQCLVIFCKTIARLHRASPYGIGARNLSDETVLY